MELIDRFYLKEVPRKKVWFRYGDWSVVNLGELMKTAPFDAGKLGVYMGWEAMRGEEMMRDENLEDLLKLLCRNKS